MSVKSKAAPITCPALFLTAPASGQGKTTVTAALARYLRNRGKSVRIFKTGPDYLDPQILEQASGNPVEQLDMWMAGESYCQQALYEAARVSDVILVEGAMGMFDGEPSSADLAERFGIPILLVMDVKGMAQTVAALATGLAGFRKGINVVGMIANHCGSERHAELIRGALPDTLPLLATMPRDPSLALPERHLGLVQASEVRDELEDKFEVGAKALAAGGLDSCGLLGIGDMEGGQTENKKSSATGVSGFSPVTFYPAETSALSIFTETLPNHTETLSNHSDALSNQTDALSQNKGKPLEGLSIGIARDAAFSFIYAANIRLLEYLGAECRFFSPLEDESPGVVDALWLPGGYPELYSQALSRNEPMKAAIKALFLSNKPILAECGGFLYCLDTLTDLEERTFPMLGLLPGQGMMRGKRGCQGMQTAVLPEGEIQAHAHHRSRSFETPEPISYGRRQRHPAPGEAIYRSRGLTATYLHMFFPSNPNAVAGLFKLKHSTSEHQEVSRVV
ncbi:cobyrinic acid a,c-diamide synthase [Hahella sp. CCB-MM4]|nr:cobyrinic acid a,c-diamide synthase [Hahella sp. CCB-MM4]